jgi:GNAT superfamily N-acetyltransferase
MSDVAATLERLLSDGDNELNALIALGDNQPIGTTHYLFHRHCWRVENLCYLQDLHVDEHARGTGAGRALIEVVYERADIRAVMTDNTIACGGGDGDDTSYGFQIQPVYRPSCCTTFRASPGCTWATTTP